MRTAALIPLLVFLTGLPLSAQPLADTLFTWRGYARRAQCRVHIYPTPPDEERTRAIVVREVAANHGPSTVQDARHLIELIGRRFGIDPETAYWIFHWGPFSYEGAAPDDDKELFLRATLHRTSTGRLSSPYWKVIDRDGVRELTDRRFQE